VGLEPLGARDGRISLFLSDALPRLHLPPSLDHLTALESRLVEVLSTGGASFFVRLHEAVGGGFAREVQEALWALVWRGIVTNDSFHPLRTLTRRVDRLAPRHAAPTRGFRSRRAGLPAAEGRWSLVHEPGSTASGVTTWAAATAQQLMHRHGLVSREVAASESIPGGFSAMHTVLRGLEESGRVRRGWFVAGLAATQFALPPVVDELRRLKRAPDTPEVVMLAATDPASAWGAALPWPGGAEDTTRRRPARSVGATVFLVNGSLAGWLERGAHRLQTWLPDDDAERALHSSALAMALAALARRRMRTGLLLAKIDDGPAREHPLASELIDAGFVSGPQGFHLRGL
jgi:ATP-dependent Lhr-like helicase